MCRPPPSLGHARSRARGFSFLSTALAPIEARQGYAETLRTLAFIFPSSPPTSLTPPRAYMTGVLCRGHKTGLQIQPRFPPHNYATTQLKHRQYMEITAR